MKKHAFTLLEILLVSGLLAILAGIVIYAINPGKQLANTRNAQRYVDVNTLDKAVYQYIIDTGSLPGGIASSAQEICRTGASDCAGLINLSALSQDAKYLVSFPIDPRATTTSGTGYYICKTSSSRPMIFSPLAELDYEIKTGTACATDGASSTPPLIPSPAHIGSLLNGGGSAPYLDGPLAVQVVGNYAYIASQNSNALEIINISNPAAPTHVGSLLNGGGVAPYLNAPRAIHVSGNYAYIASMNSDALEIVNVSNPAAPTHVGSLLNGGGSAPYLDGANAIYVSGNYAYIASYLSNALEIIDISNPAAPTHVGSLLNGGGSAPYINVPRGLYVSGNYAYIVSQNSDSLEIVDISSPASPSHTAYLLNGAGVAPYLDAPYSVFVLNNYAYVASAASDALEIISLDN